MTGLSEHRTPSDNSTAEERFNCPGGGKLNKAVKEKSLPLPFHLNLWLLAVAPLSAATHWEAWNEKRFSVYWDSCGVERTGYSEIPFSFIPARAHSKTMLPGAVLQRTEDHLARPPPPTKTKHGTATITAATFFLCPSACLFTPLLSIPLS